MKTLVRGNRNLIKAMNRNLLLNIIRREKQLSRTQVTDVSGLSVGAVSQIITDLLEKNWLLETGEGDYTGGRRQTMLRLNPNAGYAVGVKLMENRAVCAVTDFEGRVLYCGNYALDDGEYDAVTPEIVAQMVERTLNESRVARAQVFGVGIGLAGVIHPQRGLVHYSPFFGWRDYPLAEQVQDCLNLPVYVENDVNTLTLSEHLFGSGRHHDNFVVVTVGRGIGMGMVINGQLYQGARGGAGELGHIILNLPLARQMGNDSGSLEGLAADPAVIRQANLPQQPSTLAEVIRAVEAGHAPAAEALVQSGEYLGIGLATIINILCPPLMIISGEGVVAGDYRLQPMFEAMRRYTFNGLLDDVKVIVEPTDDQAWARGAASLVIGKVFESPLVEAEASG